MKNRIEHYAAMFFMSCTTKERLQLRTCVNPSVEGVCPVISQKCRLIGLMEDTVIKDHIFEVKCDVAGTTSIQRFLKL